MAIFAVVAAGVLGRVFRAIRWAPITTAPKDPQRRFSGSERAVIMARAGGRCEFHGPLGGRCRQTERLHAEECAPALAGRVDYRRQRSGAVFQTQQREGRPHPVRAAATPDRETPQNLLPAGHERHGRATIDAMTARVPVPREATIVVLRARPGIRHVVSAAHIDRSGCMARDGHRPFRHYRRSGTPVLTTSFAQWTAARGRPETIFADTRGPAGRSRCGRRWTLLPLRLGMFAVLTGRHAARGSGEPVHGDRCRPCRHRQYSRIAG
jgi:hypothetical protein